MPKEFNFLSQLTGSFSQPAAGNPTVAMIEAAYRHHGLDWRYINCEVTPEKLGDAVRGARAMDSAGFNCSLPHKIAVIEHLDGLGESAAIMRAVNCAVRRGNKYLGENTDGKGFLMSLAGIVDPRGKRIVLIGAGGAARAIGVELALAGAHSISVVNRTAERGMELIRVINENTPAKAELFSWQSKYKVQPDADVVINANPHCSSLQILRLPKMDFDTNTCRGLACGRESDQEASHGTPWQWVALNPGPGAVSGSGCFASPFIRWPKRHDPN